MAINSIATHPKIKAEDIPLEKLATSKTLSEEQKGAEAARQFEAMLVRQILTEAQKPAFPSKFSNSGVSNSIYQDMMVNQMADKISSSRTLGLAQELGSQFKHEAHPGAATPVHHASTPTTNLPKHAAKMHTPPIHPTKAPRL